MTKIQRRREVVTLYQGDYEQRISDVGQEAVRLANAAEVAEAEEKRQGPRRAGEGSRSAALRAEMLAKAQEHDAMVAEAATAGVVEVTIWALAWDESRDLAEMHPPRTDVDDQGVPLYPRDFATGVNVQTYEHPLLCAALVEPGGHENVVAMIEAGEKILKDLSPSRIHYNKLSTAAWNVNAGDVELPKVPLALLLTGPNEPDSEQPSEPE